MTTTGRFINTDLDKFDPNGGAGVVANEIKRMVPLCLDDYQTLAQRCLSKALYEYLASGTDDEQAIRNNRQAYVGWYLRPRVMRPVGHISTHCSILGHQTAFRPTSTTSAMMSMSTSTSSSMPVFASPAGVHALCEPNDGECATARAFTKMNLMFALSQHSTRSIEQVAEAVQSMSDDDTKATKATTTRDCSPPKANLWYQAYILKDRKITAQLIQRAQRAGYCGIILTVDSVRFGYRLADARNGFDALPPPHRLINYDTMIHPEYNNNVNDDDDRTRTTPCCSVRSDGPVVPDTKHISSSLDRTYNGKTYTAWDQNSELMFEQNVSWDDVRWIKQELIRNNNNNNNNNDHHDNSKSRSSRMPLVVKGIMTAQDALLAVQAGADGIMVSNHGGRQLDACLGTMDVLPEVVHALHGTGIPIWLDGGIRRGTDIVKALALGATAVGLGKPLFFALAVGGEDAVVNMLQILQRELEAAMALCGCRTIQDITPDLITRHPTLWTQQATSTSRL